MDRLVARSLAALAVTLVLASAIGGLPATVAAADEPTVRLVPATDQVGVDETTTVDLVVVGATDGVGAYNATVTVDGGAEITSVAVGGEAGLQRVDVADDGSSALVVAALMDTAERATTPVTVATLTIRGVGDGTTEAAVSVTELVDEDGHIYPAAETTGTAVRVVGAVTETPVPQSPVPTAEPAADPAPAEDTATPLADTPSDVAAAGADTEGVADAANAADDSATRFGFGLGLGLGMERVVIAVVGFVALGVLFALGVVVGRRE
jgi:hypothetical protein